MEQIKGQTHLTIGKKRSKKNESMEIQTHLTLKQKKKEKKD